MKLLFITTLNVPINKEHFFTINVIKSLGHYCQSYKDFELECITLIQSDDNSEATLRDEPNLSNEYGVNYKTYRYPSFWSSKKQVSSIAELFKAITPDIIHSNMIEGIDVRAARLARIPIVLTIHIGGFLCPRGGGNGLLRYDDTICNTGICEDCYKCVIRDLPFPKFSLSAYRLFHHTLIGRYFANRKKSVLYFTTLFRTDWKIKAYYARIEEYKYAHLIAANSKLCGVLANHYDKTHIHLLPHGVSPRKRLKLPDTNGAIKFYILSRFQYSKGIIDVLKAFKGIPHEKYELHLIGGGSTSSYADRQYLHKIEKFKRGINIFSHGWISNEDLESIIRNCHIMIHAAFFHEIYGIAIAESLSMGRGVLATRCGGAEMQIEDGKNGILYEPHSIPALHDAILKVLNNKDLIRQFSNAAELPMPIQNYVNHLVALYHDVSGC